MRPSHLLYAFASIAAIAAAPANEARASVPLGRSASIQSTVTSTSNPQPSGSGAILYPAIYDTNVTDIHNLDPQLALQVYYEEPGNGSNAAIVAFEDLKHPTVRKSGPSILEPINGTVSSGIIFVTNHPTCSDGYPAERGWILISTVAKNEASITCDYVDVLVQDIIKTVGVYFGQNSVPVNNAASPVPNSSSQSSTKSSQRSTTLAFSSKTSTTSHASTSTRPSSNTSKPTSRTSRTTDSTSKLAVASQPVSQSHTSSSSRTLTTHGSSSILRSISITSSSTSKSLKTSQTLKSSDTSSSTSTLRSTSSVSVHPSTLSSSLGSKPSSSSNTKITNASHSSSYTSTSSIDAVTKSLSFSHTSSSIGSSVSKQLSTSSALKLSSTISNSLSHSRTSTSGSSSVSKPSSSGPSGFSSFSTKHSNTQSSSTRLSSSTFPRGSTSSSGSSKPSLSSTASISSSLNTAHSTTHSTSQSPLTQISSSSISRSSTSSSNSASKSLSSSGFLKSPSLSTISHSSTQSSVSRIGSSSFSVSSTSSASTAATSQPFVTIADFDIALDDGLGYMNSSAPGFWFQLLPGTLLPQMSGFGTPPSLSTRHLQRRDWDLVSIASALTENLSKDMILAVSNVQTAFATASATIDAAVSAAIGLGIESLNALSPFTLGPFPFSATPNNNATTDFGAGVQLTSTSGIYKGALGTLTTYCIGCGVTGTFSVVGKILFDAEEGITEAVFDLTGSIHAQIEIAVIATVTASASDQKNLITQGLPDLTVPGFLVLGPAMNDGTVICVGENFTLGITDSAYADVVWGGVGTKPISTKTYPLTTWAGPTFTTCFGSLSTIHHSSSVSSTNSPTPTPTGPAGGDCDPVILADGYCSILPDNWVQIPDNPQVDAYTKCSAAAIVSWKAAVIAECGSSKACYDTYWDPLGLVTLNCGNATYSQTYAFSLCYMDYLYQWDKWFTLGFYGEYGKRSIEERKAGSIDVLSRIDGLQDRQGGFVNIVSHGTRNTTTMLAWSEDGNLVASQNGTLFATLNGNVIGDTNGRFLHYYELWMGESEISRLRLASLDMMPVGSVLVSLAPMDVGLASPSLVAFTSSGAYYYIITCTITGQLPKLFPD